MRKPMQSLLAWFLSVACLALSVLSVVVDQKNRTLQEQLQQQVAAVQAEVQKVSGVESISKNILADMGNASVSNVEIRILLARYGYTLPSATNAAAPASSDLEEGLSRVLSPAEAAGAKPTREKTP